MASTTSTALAKAKKDLAAVRKSITSKKTAIAKEKKKVIKRAALIKKYESQLKTLQAKEKKLKTSVATLTKKLKAEQAAAAKAATSTTTTTSTTTGPSAVIGSRTSTGPAIAVNPSITTPTSPTILTGAAKLAYNRHKKVVNSMDDGYPVLFFPIRIETKFVGTKLYIRVFPDEIFVKNLEQDLTETEKEESKNFWDKMYQIDRSKDTSEEKTTEKTTCVSQIIDVLGRDRAAWALKKTWPGEFLTTANLFTDKKLFKKKPDFKYITSLKAKDEDWTQAAYTDMLPDRFVFNLYDDKGNQTVTKLGNTIKTDIQLGFNPKEDLVKDSSGQQLYQKGLKWMFDYTEAVRVGLGATVTLTSKQLQEGFSKLTVVGVKYSKNHSESADKVIELFENHQFKADGMGLVEVGKATQSVEYQDLEKEGPSELDLFIDTHLRGELKGANDLKTDGERLVDALGFQKTNLSSVHHRAKVDVSNSVEMSRILWPSTIEYYLNQFSANTYTHSRNASAKKFFLDHVSGRGTLPTIQIGNQAYGVTPVTSFSKWKNSSSETFGEKLLESVLNPLYQNVFKPKSNIDISNATEAYKALSANASSKRYSARSIIGKNIMSSMTDIFINAQQQAALIKELGNMGIDHNDIPDIMQYSMSAEATALTGPVVDSGRVFAKRTLQNSGAHNDNIFGLLYKANSFESIISHKFNNILLIEQKDSLLYLYVRYAYLREAVKSSLNYLEPNKLNRAVALMDTEFHNLRSNKKLSNEMIEYMSLTETSVVKSEPKFKSLIGGLNIASAKEVSKASPADIKKVDTFLSAEVSKSVDANKNLEVPTSKWDYLNNSFSSVTGSLSMGSFLFDQMGLNRPETAELKALREALGNLKDLNVRELENLFSEHIDLTSHRLDAWLLGVANERLMNNRKTSKNGIYYGAYGFVENLKKDKKSSGAEHGYIHAPSRDQAKVAAIARSGFSDIMKEMLSDSKTQSELEGLSIDITSKRILSSLEMIDGINNGQDVRALLGFQFERALSEQRLAGYILDFRDKYGTVSSISSKGEKDAYKANNTVDGKALLEAYQKGGNSWIPATVSTPDRVKIDSILVEVDDNLDGFSDLMHVESLYQMIKSDYSGLAALLKSLNNFERIPEPEFIKTHVHALKHENRVGVIFSENGNKSMWGNTSHKSSLNPWVNEWLGNLLPTPENILVQINGTFDRSDNSVGMIDQTVSIIDLMAVEPIDLCANLPANNVLKEAFIEQHAKLFVLKDEKNITKWSDFSVDLKTIHAIEQGQYSLFEVDFIIQQANKILKDGRGLQAQDLANNTEKDELDNSAQSDLTTSLTSLTSQLKRINTRITNTKKYKTALSNRTPSSSHDSFYALYNHVVTSSLWCNLSGFPKIDPAYSEEHAEALIAFTDAYIEQAENLISSVNKELKELKESEELTLKDVKRITSMVTIDGEYVTIPFKLKTTSELAKTYTLQKFDNITSDFKVNDWLYTASKVKENLNAVMLLDQVSIGASPVMNLSEVKQLPYSTTGSNVWMGTSYEGEMDQSKISFVLLSTASSLKMTQNLSGILVADWDEQIPIKNVDTGVAFNYDAPNAKSPKNILLGVSPDLTGKWDWEDLVDIINETLDLSKTRAVTLDDLAGTPIEHFVPMTVAPIYEDEDNPSLNFLNNNQ